MQCARETHVTSSCNVALTHLSCGRLTISHATGHLCTTTSMEGSNYFHFFRGKLLSSVEESCFNFHGSNRKLIEWYIKFYFLHRRRKHAQFPTSIHGILATCTEKKWFWLRQWKLNLTSTTPWRKNFCDTHFRAATVSVLTSSVELLRSVIITSSVWNCLGDNHVLREESVSAPNRFRVEEIFWW